MSNQITTAARTAALVACIVSLASVPAPVLGIVVDSFQTPQESGSPERRVPAPEALGGTRLLSVQNGASASVLDGHLVYEQPFWFSYFSLGYGGNELGLGPIDITYGNTMDRFQVTVESCSLTGQLVMLVSSDLFRLSASELAVPVQPQSSACVHTFPLNQFVARRGGRGPATLTSIQTISLRFDSDESSGAGQLTLSSLLLTPEPAGLAMFAAVAMILAGRRRRLV